MNNIFLSLVSFVSGRSFSDDEYLPMEEYKEDELYKMVMATTDWIIICVAVFSIFSFLFFFKRYRKKQKASEKYGLSLFFCFVSVLGFIFTIFFKIAIMLIVN